MKEFGKNVMPELREILLGPWLHDGWALAELDYAPDLGRSRMACVLTKPGKKAIITIDAADFLSDGDWNDDADNTMNASADPDPAYNKLADYLSLLFWEDLDTTDQDPAEIHLRLGAPRQKEEDTGGTYPYGAYGRIDPSGDYHMAGEEPNAEPDQIALASFGLSSNSIVVSEQRSGDYAVVLLLTNAPEGEPYEMVFHREDGRWQETSAGNGYGWHAWHIDPDDNDEHGFVTYWDRSSAEMVTVSYRGVSKTVPVVNGYFLAVFWDDVESAADDDIDPVTAS